MTSSSSRAARRTGAVPDELLVSALGPNMEYEVQRIRKSSENGGNRVLSDAQLQELVRAMEKIQAHFKQVYGRENDKTFAMDLEWKITSAGKLWIKQARPVVSGARLARRRRVQGPTGRFPLHGRSNRMAALAHHPAERLVPKPFDAAALLAALTNSPAAP